MGHQRGQILHRIHGDAPGQGGLGGVVRRDEQGGQPQPPREHHGKHIDTIDRAAEANRKSAADAGEGRRGRCRTQCVTQNNEKFTFSQKKIVTSYVFSLVKPWRNMYTISLPDGKRRSSVDAA